MSHQPERREKDCLNCGAIVAGRYCQVCGQENIVPRQSVWGLITHFIYDIFHFDGKFFHTLSYLLFRPGFIPREYTAGKRMRYLDPIRMYLFTSAIFFLIFFSMKGASENLVDFTGDRRLMTKLERLEYSSVLHQQVVKGRSDTLVQRQLNLLLDTNQRVYLQNPGTPDNDSSFLVNIKGANYLMEARRPSQKEEEVNLGSGWLGKNLAAKWVAYRTRFADDEKAMIADLIDSFTHKFPYLLFVSLPFFALILKLLYIRRKQFLYADHAVFTLYHYIFTFILLLLYFLMLESYEWLEWGVLKFMATLIFLSGGVYLFIAMKRFYGQKWLKTLGKFLLLNILALVVIFILMLAFIVFSVFQL